MKLGKVICVTGTPGTGKTVVAKALAKKLNYKYIDVNEVIVKYKLVEGYDKKRQCNIVDEKKLAKVLIAIIKERKKGLVIDSHLSHYIPANYVDLCIVTKCDLKALKKRLEGRGYLKEKVRENMDAEIFDLCYAEAVENFHNVKVVDTTRKNIHKLVESITVSLQN